MHNGKQPHSSGFVSSQLIGSFIRDVCRLGTIAAVFVPMLLTAASRAAEIPRVQERMIEWTFSSQKPYADPFNDVQVDVVFRKGSESWRVPAFWRGGQSWTVRFAPPAPGQYAYRLESTDRDNPDLNGRDGEMAVAPYTGKNPLFKHGMLKISADQCHFEYEDGTPFYWLGDTWWTGLSDRLPWEGFKRLAADRSAKGFTVVQIVAGLIPPEELAPTDPGFANEGGAVWDPQFKRINPRYFDYADRRIQRLLDEGLTPAIVGAWGPLIQQAGITVLKKHWRYIIARYGAYPVLWIAGGEVYDPPEAIGRKRPGYRIGGEVKDARLPGWSDVVRYIRAVDPYHHPVSVHDMALVPALQQDSLSDYYLFQVGHDNWNSIPLELARLQQSYSDIDVIKPRVIGEIDYEKLGGHNLEDVQRVAFWEAMLNGAAGYTYGANGTWESYAPDKMLHRVKYSFMTWEEGMRLPGSYEVGLGAKLLRRYPWWRFQPHREWVVPRGDVFVDDANGPPAAEPRPFGASVIEKGNFFLPYAAGIPKEMRFIYIPPGVSDAPTILGLERGIRYRAYFWDPVLGIQFDLGTVERPAPGPILAKDDFSSTRGGAWMEYRLTAAGETSNASPHEGRLKILQAIRQADLVAAVGVEASTDVALVVRFQDADNYLTAVYSPAQKAVYLQERRAGVDGPPLGRTDVPEINGHIRLSVEVRGAMAAASVAEGDRTTTTPIVGVENRAGRVGLFYQVEGSVPLFDQLEVRQSPALVEDPPSDRKLYDAEGRFRGEMRGGGITIPPWGGKIPGWDTFGKHKNILLDAYRPDGLPYPQDWVLVLGRDEAMSPGSSRH